MGIVHKNNHLLDNMSSQLDRPFKCSWDKPHCSKRFNRKSDLARHYRIHTNERPYYCDFADCGKSFIQRSALTVHKRTHTGEKPHKCGHHGCDKKFSDSSSLARHRRIHNGTKPYTCPTYCGKQFCRKTTLTRHIQKCHQGEVVAEEVEFKWDDEASESDPDAESDDELVEQVEPEPSVEVVSAAPDVKMVLRPRNYNYRRDYWPLPCETSQEARPVVYPHTPTEVMQGQMGQAHLEQQAMINHQIQMDRQAQIDRQAQLDHQSQVDMQARLDHQAQVDHQARVDRQAQIDHQARIEQQQAQMDQHFNQMEYVPMQPVHSDSYYQPPQMVRQPPPTVISSYLNAMTLNEQPPTYDQTQFYFDDNKLLDFQLPSARMAGDHYWQ